MDQLRELFVNVKYDWLESLRLSHPHKLYEAVGEDLTKISFDRNNLREFRFFHKKSV